MTERERFENMLDKSGIIGEADEIIELVSDFLSDQADRLEKAEPYATVSIDSLRSASNEVWSMLDSEIEEGE